MTQTMGHRVDVVVIGLEQGVMAASLSNDEVCALGTTEAQAIEAFHALCTHLLTEEPDFFSAPPWEGVTPHTFVCEISGYVSGQFIPFRVHLAGVVAPEVRGGGSHVFLPQLEVHFTSAR